jgi:MFS family permease
MVTPRARAVGAHAPDISASSTPSTRLTRRPVFAALEHRNYRRYLAGQGVSLVGSWMQLAAQSWMLLQLTHSGTQVGALIGAQALPALLLGPYAGLVADRVDKRRLMIGLQTVMAVLALALGILTVTGLLRVWHIWLVAVLLGLTNCFENPARQALLPDLVGPAQLANASHLYTLLVSAACALGPALAGVVISLAGPGVCFLANAASFAAVILALMWLDLTQLAQPDRAPHAPHQLREGLRYVRRTPSLLVPLVMLALVCCLAVEFQVLLPPFASSFGDARTFGFLAAAVGVGTMIGGLAAAALGRHGIGSLSLASVLFSAALLLAAVVGNLATALVAMLLVGVSAAGFIAVGNSTLHAASAPAMRGRVMALWTVAFTGSTPVGGPIIGAVSQYFSPRAALLVGALACLTAAVIGAITRRR